MATFLSTLKLWTESLSITVLLLYTRTPAIAWISDPTPGRPLPYPRVGGAGPTPEGT